VHSMGSEMDAILHREVLQRPSIGTVQIIMWYHISLCTFVISQLLFWHIPCLMFSLWATCVHACCTCSTSCLTQIMLQSLKHISVDDISKD
jgi:hypothetical protein